MRKKNINCYLVLYWYLLYRFWNL